MISVELMDEEVMNEEKSIELADKESSIELVEKESSIELIDEDISVGLGLEVEDATDVLEESTTLTGEVASHRPNSD
jgi:hypothetical protein